MEELKNKINTWKQEFGKVYQTIVDDDIYIWRKLKRKEYIAILNNKSTDPEDIDDKVFERQEIIVKTAILYPENIEQDIENAAGLATALSEEILAKSGFGVSNTIEL